MTRFEDLPNELLTDIFKNLDARSLFRAFYNLNARINQQIQSFQYLQLVFHINQTNLHKINDEIFSYSVYTLIIDPWINVNLIHFPNVRCLKLNNPLPEVLAQIKPELMPYLEHLSVQYKFNMYEMDLLRDKIFSNRFTHLQTCELYEEKTLMTKPNCTQSPLIKNLKVEFIDLNIYQTILSSCLNLYFLKFSIYPFNGLSNNNYLFLHENLKQMIIDYRESDWYNTDDYHRLNGFLSCVPNLEILNIHRKIDFENLQQIFEQYDWFASIIHIHLPRLRKFKYILHLLKAPESLNEMQIRTNFNDVHNNQYKAQLEIRRE